MGDGSGRGKGLDALVESELRAGIEDWWWLSFADDDGFLGAAIVRAHGIGSASLEAHRQQCNPGGEVQAVRLVTEPAAADCNRLLSREEATALADFYMRE